MRRIAAIAFLLLWCGAAQADILKMKSGQTKRGKILAEDEKRILLDSETDGSVVDVPKSEISIFDREVSEGDREKGRFLNYYSASPKKKAKTIEPEKPSGPAKRSALPRKFSLTSSASASFEKIETMIESWLMANHPEWTEWYTQLKERYAQKSLELDKLAAAVKQS